jgi:hypothetical protein
MDHLTGAPARRKPEDHSVPAKVISFSSVVPPNIAVALRLASDGVPILPSDQNKRPLVASGSAA